MNISWENVRGVLAAAASAGIFGALTIFLGRMWTQSYYAVFGLPTADLDFDVMDYAFQTKEVLLMLLIAALVSGALALPEGVRSALRSDLPRAGLRGGAQELSLLLNDSLARLPLPGSLGAVGRLTLLCGLAGLAVLGLLAKYKPAGADELWGSFGLLGLWGGVSLGLAIGPLAVAVGQGEHLRRVPPAVLVAGLVIVFLPWSIGELAEFQALRDIRQHVLPQAIIEFREQAPAAIRRSDDPTRTDLVYLVLATESRLAVAHPFGCKGVGEPESVVPEIGSDEGTPRSTVCDIFTFDRADVRTIRVFGRGTERPFNDERSKPDIVEFRADQQTSYDQELDLTGAQTDDCGRETLRDAPGVWLRLDALQSGRVSFERRPELLYLSPAEKPEVCTNLPNDSGVLLHVNDKLMVLAAAPEADRIVRRLNFTFLPLEFRPADVRVSEQTSAARGVELPLKAMTVPFLATERSVISVIVDRSTPSPVSMECEQTVERPPVPQPELPIEVTLALSASDFRVSLCPDPSSPAQPGTGSITFTTEQPIDSGIWELSLRWSEPSVESFRIILTPVQEAVPVTTPTAGQ